LKEGTVYRKRKRLFRKKLKALKITSRGFGDAEGRWEYGKDLPSHPWEEGEGVPVMIILE